MARKPLKKILILGSSGMLGSMVYDYFKKDHKLFVEATTRNKKDKTKRYFEVNNFLEIKHKYSYLKTYDYIINCIGAIKFTENQKNIYNAIKVNSLFPHELSSFLNKSKTKIIQIATDCVFSGKNGAYNESFEHDDSSVYGKTKSLGEVNNDNFLNIRCSIIGPEKLRSKNLMQWVLSQKNDSVIQGFSDYKWNGVTTLQFAKLCSSIINRNMFNKIRKINHTHHYVPNNSTSKYELVKMISEIFEKKIKVIKVKKFNKPINRTLSSRYKILQLITGKSTIKGEVLKLKYEK